MPRPRKILRLIAWTISALCMIVLMPATAIRLDQYLLRRNAEYLLADLKSLEMRKSTYHDALQVIDRWKDSIHESGPCQPDRCEVEIGVSGFFGHHREFFHHERLMQVWRVLGGRPAEIDGFIQVRRDVVWGKGIRVVVLSYSTRYKADVALIGRMGSGPPSSVSPLHPEYDAGIPRPMTGPLSVGAYADFTPYADPADVSRLMDIDFSCLTRWRSCQTGADIAPAAWHEATAENEERATRNLGEMICSPGVVRVLARESRRAVIGEVNRISVYSPYPGNDDLSFAQVKMLLMDDLKQSNLNFLSALQDYSFNESLPAKEKVGDRFILFFRYKDDLYLDTDRVCSLLPATKENLETVRRGVAEDLSDQSDAWQSAFRPF
jgi:hypothetical protein